MSSDYGKQKNGVAKVIGRGRASNGSNDDHSEVDDYSPRGTNGIRPSTEMKPLKCNSEPEEAQSPDCKMKLVELGLSCNKAPYSESYSYQRLSTLRSGKEIKESDNYSRATCCLMPIVRFGCVLFVAASPIVGLFGTSTNYTPASTQTRYSTQNTTTLLTAETNFQVTEQCLRYNGVTLAEVVLRFQNISNPNFGPGKPSSSDVPSVALFGSDDLKTFYNFFSPQDNQDAFPSNMKDAVLILNQRKGLGCLGDVSIKYLVACLNVNNLAQKYKLGQQVPGFPFNDQCFQLTGICGAPGTNVFNYGPPPNQCNQAFLPSTTTVTISQNNTENITITIPQSFGVIPQSELITPVNETTTLIVQETFGNWGDDMSTLDWVILALLFLNAFSNILKFTPVMSGRPKEVLADGAIPKCEGNASLAMVTPIVDEDHSLLLRSLLGRTLTALLTVDGKKHELNGLYVDAILNEDRKGNMHETRYRLWKAWFHFLTQIIEISVLPEQSLLRNNNHSSDLTENSCSTKSTSTSSTIDIEAQNAVTDHSISIFKVSCQSMEKLIKFLHEWMKAVERNELNYGYPLSVKDSKEDRKQYEKCLEAFFLDANAPVRKVFEEDKYRDPVECALKKLQQTFLNAATTTPPAIKNPILGHTADSETKEENTANQSSPSPPMRGFPDQIEHIHWEILDSGNSLWAIDWTLFSRSKLVEKEKTERSWFHYCRETKNTESPNENYRDECTRLLPNAIVYKRRPEIVTELRASAWLESRQTLYRIVSINSEGEKPTANLEPFENPVANNSPAILEENVPLNSLSLIEENRGKAGALNTFLEYYRVIAREWSQTQLSEETYKLFYAILDARHMIVKPEIFWNYALPYFATSTITRKNLKDFGDDRPCILVQYPQRLIGFHTYLNNKNEAFYTIDQTIYDCALCMTSSGTNGIWDMSHPEHRFATSCRIEDTATSHQFLYDYISVHLPCFVANGVTKKEQDYLDSIHRWTTGAVELFYPSLVHHFASYFIILLIFLLYAAAWGFFWWIRPIFGCIVWWTFIGLAGIVGCFEKFHHRKPFRRLAVAMKIVQNTTYWISNLVAPMWSIIVPCFLGQLLLFFFHSLSLNSSSDSFFLKYKAFNGQLAFAGSNTQSFVWILIPLILFLPDYLLTDCVSRIVRKISRNDERVDAWSLTHVLWRQTQLYACSWPISVMAFIDGTRTAHGTAFRGQDPTLWKSFYKKTNSKTWYAAIMSWIWRKLLNPKKLTGYYATLVLFTNLVCIFYSCSRTNQNDLIKIAITFLICGLNILLVGEIAYHLVIHPSLRKIVSWICCDLCLENCQEMKFRIHNNNLQDVNAVLKHNLSVEL